MLYVPPVMATKNDWVIWKADGKTFVMRSGKHPHTYIDSSVPCEVIAKVFSTTEEMANAVRKTIAQEWTADRDAFISGMQLAIKRLGEFCSNLDDGICLPEDQCEFCTTQWDLFRTLGEHSLK